MRLPFGIFPRFARKGQHARGKLVAICVFEMQDGVAALGDEETDWVIPLMKKLAILAERAAIRVPYRARSMTA
jgi:hypothetical protein